ncbi:MAG: hypothetical protein AAFQ63_11490 [Cyanobacteria bacterium J06621_11]
MDPTIVAAVIGGVCTVVGPVTVFLVTRHVDNRDKNIMPLGRRAVMTGQWHGTTTPESGNYSSIELSVILRAIANRKTIKGEFRVQYPDYENSPAQADEFSFQGGFLHDRFLQLDYISKAEGRIQFGSIILELSPSGEALVGRYVGYGAFSKQVVAGRVELKRSF